MKESHQSICLLNTFILMLYHGSVSDVASVLRIILNWPQWNDCIVCVYVWYIIINSCSELDCYNGCISIACVVNIWLYHWLLICRAMLDKIQLKSELKSIWTDHMWQTFDLQSTHNISWSDFIICFSQKSTC